MTRTQIAELGTYLQEWMTEPALPLEVSRSAYDDDVVSWEVLCWETPTCQMPIAEFTSWPEAQAFADDMARWALGQGAWPRRWNLSYRPDGSWGGFGYWEPERPAAVIPERDETSGARELPRSSALHCPSGGEHPRST